MFEENRDYERFILLMYVCNGSNRIHISDVKNWALAEFLNDASLDRGAPLVEIGAYALMPNHIHLVLQEIQKGGIAAFMLKVCTGYSMYFNKKSARTGPLFSGAFKSKHIADDRYLKQVVPYVLLNPAVLFDPKWKQGEAIAPKVHSKLMRYSYSSLLDFLEIKRLENIIVGKKLLEYYDRAPSLAEMVTNAQEYYRENSALPH